MNYEKFAKHQKEQFIKGITRVENYYTQWNDLKKHINNFCDALLPELEKNFKYIIFQLNASHDLLPEDRSMKHENPPPFVHFCMEETIRSQNNPLINELAANQRSISLLFVQGFYGEVLVVVCSCHSSKPRMRDRFLLYKIYTNPDKITEKKLENIFSYYFSRAVQMLYLNKPSIWFSLSTVLTRLLNRYELLKYGKSSLRAIESVMTALTKR